MEVASGMAGRARAKKSPAKLVVLHEGVFTVVGGFQQECGWISKTGQPEAQFQQAEEKQRHTRQGHQAETPQFPPGLMARQDFWWIYALASGGS